MRFGYHFNANTSLRRKRVGQPDKATVVGVGIIVSASRIRGFLLKNYSYYA